MPTIRGSTVDLIIRGRDEASRVLQQQTRELRDLETVAAQVGIALGAVSAAGVMLTKDMIRGASQLEQVRGSFTNLSASINSTADDSLQRLREATLNTIRDAELMITSNRLVAMGLAETSDEAARLAGMATQLGMHMGRDAHVAIEDFTMLLANQSIRRLDQFGLSIERVRQRQEQLATSGRGLSREMAFVQAVLEEGDRTLRDMGGSAETSAVAFAQFETAVQNLRDELGTYLLPAATDAAQAMTDLVKAIQDMPDETKEAAAGIIAIGTALTTITSAALGAYIIISKLKEPFLAIAGFVAGLAGPIAAFATGLVSASSQSRTLAGDLSTLELQIRDLATDYDSYIRYLRQAHDNLVEFYRSVGVATGNVELMDRGIALSRYEFDQYKGVLYTAAEATEESSRLIVNACGFVGEAFEEITDQSRLFGEAMKQTWQEVFREAEERGRLVAGVLEMIEDGYRQLGETIFAFQQQRVMAEEQFIWDRQIAEIEAMLAQRQAVAEHQQALMNAEAQYQAELLMLQAQGKDKQIIRLQASHEEELAQIQWRFDTAQIQAQTAFTQQEAMAQVHYAREQYLQAVAHKAQLEQQLAVFSAEATVWMKRNEALFEGEKSLYTLLLYVFAQYAQAQMDAETQLAIAHAQLEEAKANASVESARAIGRAMYGVVTAYRAAFAAAQGNIAEAEAAMREALSRLASIEITLPPIPDWSAYVPDLGDIGAIDSAARRAAGAVRDVRQEVRDFSGMIRDAILALYQLAGFEIPAELDRAARAFEDTLKGLIPMLHRLDDTLDDFISRAGMNKIMLFADTVSKLASSLEGLLQLASFMPSMNWARSFELLSDVLMDLARALHTAYIYWDRFLPRSKLEEIAEFGDAIRSIGAVISDVAEFEATDFIYQLQDFNAAIIRTLESWQHWLVNPLSMGELGQILNWWTAIGAVFDSMNAAVSAMGRISEGVTPAAVPAMVGSMGGGGHFVFEVRASGFTTVDSRMADEIGRALARQAGLQGVLAR